MEKYYGIGLMLLYSIIYLSSSIFIQKKKNHQFLSLRSTNVLHVTNTNIFFSFIIIGILILYELSLEVNIKLILEFLLLICHIITFASFVCKYVRFYKCTQISLGDDDLTEFKKIKSQKYYYEYFYIRIILTLFGACTVVLTIVFLVLNYGLELGNAIKENYDSIIILIRIIPFFVENMILLTCSVLLRNKSNLGWIKTELIILLVVNIIFSIALNIAFGFFSKSISLFNLSCLIFLFCLQCITILCPIIRCWFDKVNFGYHITKESANDLYLFLSNEKCYNSFESFLMSEQERDNNRFILDLYTHVIKYRIKYIVEDIHLNKLNEGKLIHKKYFDKDKEILSTEDNIILNMRKKNENLLKNNECKLEMFDEALEKAYSYLNGKYINFKKTEEFAKLINEIDYDTYIWCKLADCGLIK